MAIMPIIFTKISCAAHTAVRLDLVGMVVEITRVILHWCVEMLDHKRRGHAV